MTPPPHLVCLPRSSTAAAAADSARQHREGYTQLSEQELSKLKTADRVLIFKLRFCHHCRAPQVASENKRPDLSRSACVKPEKGTRFA